MIAAVWNIGGALAQTSLDAVIIAGSHGNVTAFNAAAQGMFGHGRDHAVGRSIADSVVPGHHRSPHQAAMTRCMSGQPARVMGRRLEAETRSTLCDDAGRMTGILSVAQSISRSIDFTLKRVKRDTLTPRANGPSTPVATKTAT